MWAYYVVAGRPFIQRLSSIAIFSSFPMIPRLKKSNNKRT